MLGAKTSWNHRGDCRHQTPVMKKKMIIIPEGKKEKFQQGGDPNHRTVSILSLSQSIP